MAPVQIGVSDFRFFDIMRHVNNCYYAESKRWLRFGMKWRGLLRRNLGDAAFFDGFFLCCWGWDAVAHQMSRVVAKRRRCMVDMVAVRLGRTTRILGEMVVMRGV